MKSIIMSMKTTPMFQSKINKWSRESLKMVINDDSWFWYPKSKGKKKKRVKRKKPEERIREEKESGQGCEEECCCCCCCRCFPSTPKTPRALEPARGCNSIPSHHRWIFRFPSTTTIHLLPLYRSRFPLQKKLQLKETADPPNIYMCTVNYIFLFI